MQKQWGNSQGNIFPPAPTAHMNSEGSYMRTTALTRIQFFPNASQMCPNSRSRRRRATIYFRHVLFLACFRMSSAFLLISTIILRISLVLRRRHDMFRHMRICHVQLQYKISFHANTLACIRSPWRVSFDFLFQLVLKRSEVDDCMPPATYWKYIYVLMHEEKMIGPWMQ